MSYLEVPVKVEKDAVMHYRVVGPSDVAPTPEQGYQIAPEPIMIEGVPGKFWIEFKIVEV